MPASTATIDRIYHAAEQLFANKGYSEISLRLITAKAKVNLAAVNYHFGSKQGLIEAIFSKYLSAFCTELKTKLDFYENQQKTIPSTEELLTIFMELTISVKTHTTKGIVTFMRLLSGALMQEQLFLHEYLIKNYGDILYRYVILLKKSVKQNIPDIEWFWRVHFGLGAMLQNMACIDFLKIIVKAEFKTSIKTTQVIQLMIPFISEGLSAKPTLTEPELISARYYLPYLKKKTE